MKKPRLFINAGMLFFTLLISDLSGGIFRFPLDVKWNVTQDFLANNPGWGTHLAEDIACSGGTPVYAASAGTVKFAGYASSYERVIIIEHGAEKPAVCTLYGHLSKSLGLKVTAGQNVNIGDLIGYIAFDDEDGGIWKPHLHFGIAKGSYSTAWIYYGYAPRGDIDGWYDPTDFINSHMLQPALVITNPLASYTWNYAQQKVKVEWTYQNYSGNVAIDLYDGNVNLKRVMGSVPVTQRSAEFDLPGSVPPGTNYKIGLSDEATGNPWTFSGVFAIRKLTVIYPNGGESLNAGQTFTLKLSSNFVTDPVAVDLYRGDINFGRLASIASAADGAVNITIPAAVPGGDNYKIAVSSHNGCVWDFSDSCFSVLTKTSGLTEQDKHPKGFVLEQNYPNPFNPVTTISYSVVSDGHVKLSVFDLQGREAAVCVDEYKDAGQYTVHFDGRGLAGGVYLYRLEAGQNSITKKLTVMK